MSKTPESVARLIQAGFASHDADALRRASMTLHRWHEGECGLDNGYASYCIVRGRRENGEFVYDDAGKPFHEWHYHRGDAKAVYRAIGDRERGARKRIAKILKRYPGFSAYVQGDPRGCALYIMRPGDVKAGEDVSSVYTRGIAVYK